MNDPTFLDLVAMYGDRDAAENAVLERVFHGTSLDNIKSSFVSLEEE